jgi:2'-5' RNA ligase
MTESLYMFAIMPPQGLAEEIDNIRHQFAENFKCYKALKPPVHITLFPPFKTTGDIEQRILPLQKWTGQQLPFILHLNNFSFFENRKSPVLFIDVIKNDALKNLHSGFLRQIKLYMPGIEIEKAQYHPHFTIGYRDISPEMMPEIKKAYTQRNFTASFEVKSIYLWKHDSVNWKTRHEFTFSDNTIVQNLF